MKENGASPSLRSSASSSGTLTARLGQHRNSPIKASLGDLPLAPKAIELWLIRTCTTGAFGLFGKPPRSWAERRGGIERTMHQTWRFKRMNGTAYSDSIASILRDASGAKVARLRPEESPPRSKRERHR